MILEDRLQRIAFARVISDLIEADSVIEAAEINTLEEIMSEYNISPEMLAEAKTRNLEWSLRTLASATAEQRDQIKKTLKNLSLTDGTCVPNEALQIMATVSVLDGTGEVFSVASNETVVDNQTVIFIEDSNASRVDDNIRDNYRSISNEFHLAGFRFVYIPKISSDYKQMEPEYLHKAICYMAPTLAEDRVSAIQRDLCSITTSRFCRELLYRKLGIGILGCQPSLLIKIGDSFIADSIYQEERRICLSNFLKVGLSEDVLTQITDFLDQYKELVNCVSTVEVLPPTKRFIYSGFHRSLFNLIAFYHERTEYKLVIDIQNKAESVLSFSPVSGNLETESLRLTPLASALYILIIQQSQFGNGLDWREHPGSVEKNRILQSFNTIYSYIGNRESPVEYKDRILVSRIKKELRKQQDVIANIDSFIPMLQNQNNCSSYYVPASSKEIFVIEDGREIPMAQSRFWSNL